MQVLQEPVRDPSAQSWSWVQSGGPPDKPVILFDYTASRAQEVPLRLLDGYRGYLMTDDYAGYNAVAALHRQGGRRSAGRAGRRLAVASLARPAAPVVPLPLPQRPRVPVAQRRNRAALPPIARWSAPRLAQRLSVSVGTIALRLGRAVRARRRAG